MRSVGKPASVRDQEMLGVSRFVVSADARGTCAGGME